MVHFARTSFLLALTIGGASAFAQTTPPVEPAPATAQPVPQQIFILQARPVKTTKEAREYIAEWIHASGIKEIAAGKRLQEAGGIFIADLTNPKLPLKMENQLLIRKADGLVSLIYPANQTPTAEQQLAAMGLEGMSGMTGTRGALQRKVTTGHGNLVAIANSRHAQRGIDAWLWINGLGNLHAGPAKDLGGVYVASILDDRNTRKNQAVVRKADGYVQMINPIKLTSAK